MELKILKTIVSNYLVLKIFNTDIPILVQCDASSEALGCCLMQDGHPVAFASKCLTKTQQKSLQAWFFVLKNFTTLCMVMMLQFKQIIQHFFQAFR